MRYKGFLDLLRFMRRSFESINPICVRRIKMPSGMDGDCQLRCNVFIVRIEKTLSENHAIDTLLHELSHCLSWNEEVDVHGPSWGQSYSVVYRKFLEWRKDKE